MTSNQIAYWKNQEEIRTNKAKESEAHRHNVNEEAIKRVQNELEARGLDIKTKEQLLKAADLFQKYGATSYSSLPEGARRQIEEMFGTEPVLSQGEGTSKEWLSGAIGDLFRWTTGGRGVGGFF